VNHNWDPSSHTRRGDEGSVKMQIYVDELNPSAVEQVHEPEQAKEAANSPGPRTADLKGQAIDRKSLPAQK
jgi:hypothetical protein